MHQFTSSVFKGGFTVGANASREMNHSFAGTESRFAFSRETSNMAVLSRKQIIIIIMLLRRRLRQKKNQQKYAK